MRLEEGNGFLLDGLGKWGGAECKIKYKGLGEGGNEAVLGGGKNRWMTRVAGGSEPEEQGRRGMKSEIREALLLQGGPRAIFSIWAFNPSDGGLCAEEGQDLTCSKRLPGCLCLCAVRVCIHIYKGRGRRLGPETPACSGGWCSVELEYTWSIMLDAESTMVKRSDRVFAWKLSA